MGNSGWTADPDFLLVPPDAVETEPRIFIGGNQDPIIAALGEDAGIVLYFGEQRAFLISVEQVGPPGSPEDIGRLHIWAFCGFPSQLHTVVNLDYDIPNNSVDWQFNADTPATGTTKTVSLHGNVVGLGPAAQPPSTEPLQDVYLFGAPIARGDHSNVESTSNSAAIGTTETVVLTIASDTYYAGRTYEVTLKSGVFGSASTNLAEFRVRKTNAAGQDLGEFFYYPTLGAGAQVMAAHGLGLCFTVGASDVTAALVLTLKASAGTVTHFANATNPRSLRTKDVTDTVNFGSFPVLT